MALSGVENLARVPDLRRRLMWTALLLVAYRLGVHVPVPGIDTVALSEFFKSMQNTLFGVFDMFSGGGLRNLSVFALGVMPYISASIIMQLLQVVSPDLKRMAKEEGAAGRKKVTQYTRYGTVLIMWLGEQITEKGIGNGISLVIFSGIVAGIPRALHSSYELLAAGSISVFLAIALVVFMAVVLIGIVFVERAQRRIPVHYAKRQVGRKMYGGQTTHLPLKVNTAGVIPPIFASSLLIFPATVAQLSTGSEWLQRAAAWFSPTTVLYNVLFIGLIVFFCFFYTAIIFDPKDIAENLKKQGGFVPGIRPGAKTREYIDKVLTRITLWGALYITLVCVIPQVLMSNFNVPFYFGGTSLLIVVGVAMDFMSQIESHLISRQYEGLMGKTRLKGR